MYRNVSKLKLPKKCIESLLRPVELKELFLNEKNWIYLSMEGYQKRLDEAFIKNGIRWELQEIGLKKTIKNTVYQTHILYIDDCFISQSIGEALASWSDDKIDYELRYTALVRCCKELLIASELWEPRLSKKLSLMLKKDSDLNKNSS